MRFGDFSYQCRDVPSYPWCNLFFRQLLEKSPSTLTGSSSNQTAAPIGVNPECGIGKYPGGSSLPNVANIAACGLSFFLVLALIFKTSRRKAAVGRVELRAFLVLYLISLPLQLITTGSFLEQGGKALSAVTALHAGVIAALFWSLLANGIVATQVVEDGTLSSLIPFHVLSLVFFIATGYISLDIAFGFTQTIGGVSNPPESLHSIPLFVLTSVWPGAAAILYFGLMAYIVLGVLREVRPMWYYSLSFILFVLSQLDFFLLNKIICKGAKAKVDGSFIATILESAAVFVLYLAWKSITEESWDEDQYYPS